MPGLIVCRDETLAKRLRICPNMEWSRLGITNLSVEIFGWMKSKLRFSA
jgi:hypothetical protein